MNFTTFDLNLLRVLDALLREGSTIKAGVLLGMSQSSVSGALSRLRQSLGDELFVRQGQGLKPTDYALSLAIPVRQQLDQLEELLVGADAFDPAISTMTFKMAGADFFAETLMPELARRLRTEAPGIRAQLIDLVPQNYIDSLERFEADLAFIPDEEFPSWTDRRTLFQSTYVAVAAHDNPVIARAGIAPRAVLPMDLFCALGHVLFSPEGKTSAAGDMALARVGRARNVVMTVPVFFGVCRAVSESDLIALIPNQIADRLARVLGLSVFKPPMDIEPVSIVGVWHKRSSNSPAHRWMRERVAEILIPLSDG